MTLPPVSVKWLFGRARPSVSSRFPRSTVSILCPMSGVWLGIDYGTSNTVAVLRWPDGRTRPLLFDSSPLLPSAVYASGDGRLIVGRDAERSARSDPARFEQNPKRRVDDLDVLLGGHTYPVTDLIAAVLRHVGDEARRTAGAAVGRISMTHPVTWGPARRRVLEAATARAGLPAPLLVPEPVAAAAYFTSSLGHVVKPGQSVVVYDLGAGTFDASVVRRTPAGFDTLAYSGLDDVGGLDLDAVMVQMIIDVVDQEAPDTARRLREPGTSDERRQRIHLWQDARQARETLSRESSVTVYPAVGLRDVLITRDQFEAAAAALLERTIRITTATVKEARVRPDDLAGWFLVGGATRTPLVATLLHRQTGQAATVIEEPQLVVAEGALRVVAGYVGPAATDLATRAARTPPRPASPAPPAVPAPARPAATPTTPTATPGPAVTAAAGRPGGSGATRPPTHPAGVPHSGPAAPVTRPGAAPAVASRAPYAVPPAPVTRPGMPPAVVSPAPYAGPPLPAPPRRRRRRYLWLAAVIGVLFVASAVLAANAADMFSSSDRNADTGATPTSTTRSVEDVAAPDDGRPPFLGISVTDREGGGVLIGAVSPGSPAAKAGLQVGDVIVEFALDNVTTADRFVALVRQYKPGDRVPIVILRNGSTATILVTLVAAS